MTRCSLFVNVVVPDDPLIHLPCLYEVQKRLVLCGQTPRIHPCPVGASMEEISSHIGWKSTQIAKYHTQTNKILGLTKLK